MAKAKQTEEYLGAQVESDTLRGLGVPEQAPRSVPKPTYGATNLPANAKRQVGGIGAGNTPKPMGIPEPLSGGLTPKRAPTGGAQAAPAPTAHGASSRTAPGDPNPMGPVDQITKEQYGKNPIYRNDNVDHDKYGAAIFSGSRRGATEGGFDESIAKGGAGAFDPVTGQPLQSGRKNEFGHDMTLTDSYNKQIADIQAERQGRVDAAREQNQGYGGLSRAQHEQKISNMFEEARGILKKLPYGSPKDKGRRANMVAEAKSLMGMAGKMQGVSNAMMGRDAMASKMGIASQQWNQQFNRQNLESDRRFGVDVLNASKSDKPNYQKTTVATGQRDKEGNLVLGDDGNPLTKEVFFDPSTGKTVAPQQRGQNNQGGGVQPPPPNSPAFNWGTRHTAQVIKSQAEYSKLPSGAQFTAPDGSVRTKP